MSRREPMTPVTGLKKPDLPAPIPRPLTLAPLPAPVLDEAEQQLDTAHESASLAAALPDPIPAASRATKVRRTPPSHSTPSQKPAPSRSQDADTIKAVAVSVPVSLAEAWRARARRDRTSQVDVLLDSLVAHQDALADLVAQRTEKPTVSDGLFDRTPSLPGERFVGVSLRIRSKNLDVIDRLATKHGAESRSQLVAAALSAYLD